MSEPARYLFPADRMLGDAGRFGWPGVSLSRGELSGGTVRPAGVVVPQVLGQYRAQVVFIDDQQPSGDLPAQGADAPFGDRVRFGWLWRAADNPDAALRGDHGIDAGELARAIPDHELG